MRSESLRVPRGEGERVRRRLIDGGWLRSDLLPVRERTHVSFPVHDLPDPLPEGLAGERSEGEFPSQAPRRPRDYRELVDLPMAQKELLPTSFDVIGDVVLIRLPREIRDEGPRVGAALLAFVPGCRRVGLDLGVQGETRLRQLLPLAGQGGWETVHRENGLSFHVDLERAYFSPRLAGEHERLANSVRPGENLLDLFCGVGPFALTALRRQQDLRATAVDLNPRAIELLRANARALRVDDRLEVVEGTAEAFLSRETRFQRVVMNLPREGYKYTTSVARHVMPGGTLHHYEIVPRDQVDTRAAKLLGDVRSAGEDRWSVAPPRVVHAYSPSSDLLAWTLFRGA